MMTKHVFGPVPSRRFGRSLGVSPLPGKTCNYSCVYCQLGRTPRLQRDRRIFHPAAEVVEDIRKAVESADGVDFITFMGDGEPLLAENLGEMVEGVRQFWDGGLALITNGSLFRNEEVRRSVHPFDVISPTIASGDERTFRRLHRPSRTVVFGEVVEGLCRLREEYTGQIWAEVMLVRGVNDELSSLLDIREVLRKVRPDRTYLTVPTRPPAEGWVAPPTESSLRLAMEVLTGSIDMTQVETGPFLRNEGEREGELVRLASNHPLREGQALEVLALAMGEEIARETLLRLVSDGRLKVLEYSGTKFFVSPSKSEGLERTFHDNH